MISNLIFGVKKIIYKNIDTVNYILNTTSMSINYKYTLFSKLFFTKIRL